MAGRMTPQAQGESAGLLRGSRRLLLTCSLSVKSQVILCSLLLAVAVAAASRWTRQTKLFLLAMGGPAVEVLGATDSAQVEDRMDRQRPAAVAEAAQE